MKMGSFEYTQNIYKAIRLEADYYYDTKLQNEDGDEFYVRFTEIEIKAAERRAIRQFDEINKDVIFGHVFIVNNMKGPKTEAAKYADIRGRDKYYRFTLRELTRAIHRGVTQNDEIEKTSWWRNLWD